MDPSQGSFSKSSLKTLTRQQLKSAIIGMVLGDGHLGQQRRRDGVYRGKAYMDIGHARRQKQYLEFKRDLLQKLFQYPIKINDKICHLKKTGKDYPVVTLRTRVHPRLTQIHSLMYEKSSQYPRGRKIVTKDILNKLTPLALAIWYMDDGTLGKVKKKNGKVNYYISLRTDNFTYDEHLLIKEWFKERLGIDFRITRSRGNYHLRKGISQGYKLIELIRPFILDCLKYKIDYQFGDRGIYDLDNDGKKVTSTCQCGAVFSSYLCRVNKFHSRECYQLSRVTAPDTHRG